MLHNSVSQSRVPYPTTEGSSDFRQQNDRGDDRFVGRPGLVEPCPTTRMLPLMCMDQGNVDTGINDSHESPALLSNEFHATLFGCPGGSYLLGQGLHPCKGRVDLYLV